MSDNGSYIVLVEDTDGSIEHVGNFSMPHDVVHQQDVQYTTTDITQLGVDGHTGHVQQLTMQYATEGDLAAQHIQPPMTGGKWAPSYNYVYPPAPPAPAPPPAPAAASVVISEPVSAEQDCYYETAECVNATEAVCTEVMRMIINKAETIGMKIQMPWFQQELVAAMKVIMAKISERAAIIYCKRRSLQRKKNEANKYCPVISFMDKTTQHLVARDIGDYTFPSKAVTAVPVVTEENQPSLSNELKVKAEKFGYFAKMKNSQRIAGKPYSRSQSVLKANSNGLPKMTTVAQEEKEYEISNTVEEARNLVENNKKSPVAKDVKRPIKPKTAKTKDVKAEIAIILNSLADDGQLRLDIPITGGEAPFIITTDSATSDTAHSDNDDNADEFEAPDMSPEPPVEDTEVAMEVIEDAASSIILEHDYQGIEAEDDVTVVYARIFQCQICFREYIKRPEMYKHIKKFHTDTEQGKVFVCSLCDESLDNRMDMDSHTLLEHESKHNYICPKCDRVFIDQEPFAAHMMDTTIPGHEHELIFCSLCPCYYTAHADLDIHMNRHMGRKEKGTYPCLLCPKILTQRHRLDEHMAKLHPGGVAKIMTVKQSKPSRNGTNAYQCEHCYKMYKTISQVNQHVKVAHSTHKYKCDVPGCEKEFATTNYFRRHLMRVHYQTKPHACPICGTKFAEKGKLTLHVRRHMGDRRHQCPVCSKRFMVKAELRKHSVVHTTLHPFTCNECGKTFRYACNMNIHKRKHRGQKIRPVPSKSKKRKPAAGGSTPKRTRKKTKTSNDYRDYY